MELAVRRKSACTCVQFPSNTTIIFVVRWGIHFEFVELFLFLELLFLTF
jgi:hypothetical protein